MEKYTKMKAVGKGNMGTVVMVRNNEDGKIYVMKLIDLSKMNKKERTASLNEAKVLSSLAHPNIINYVDSFLSRKTEHLCIVMEYAAAGDLSHKIKQQKGRHFAEELVLDWFIQLCFSIKYCHQKKVLHRDIKTQNVFLTASGVIKVGDFGISRVLANTFDCAHTFVGTPYYLSPELVQERPYNSASDVWALGVVLYELLALRHPFNANDMKGLMYKILRVMYDPPPPLYSAELRDIVPHLLVKDPTRRLTVNQILELPVIRRRVTKLMAGAADGSDTFPRPYLSLLMEMGLVRNENSWEADAYDSSDEEASEHGNKWNAVPQPKAKAQDRKAIPTHLLPLQDNLRPQLDLMPPMEKGRGFPPPIHPPKLKEENVSRLPPLGPVVRPAHPMGMPDLPADAPISRYHPPYPRGLQPPNALAVPRVSPSVVSGQSSDSRQSAYSQYYEGRRQAEANRNRNAHHRFLPKPGALPAPVNHGALLPSNHYNPRGWRG